MEKETILQHVREQANKWLNSNIDEATRKEILYLLKHDEKELIESFYRVLEFGTGGLRGIMGAGTNRMNIYTVGMATQGLCNYLLKAFQGLEEISVAIAHDCRNNSRLFAETTAQICTANGIKAYLFDELRPTPELSFAIRELNCQSGVVVTASHNPKEYNGYKVYWEDGGQIIHPHDTNIINEVKSIQSIDEIKFDGNENMIQPLGEEMDKKYLEKVKELSLNPESIRKHSEIKIVYTPIHGTGVKMVPNGLRKVGFTQIYNVPEQDEVNGDFPTVVSPNPEESAAMNLALQKADEIGADLVMATDPDADRVGIAIRDPHEKMVLLNGNQTAVLITYYLLSQWSEKGYLKGNEYMVKTVVTTELMADIARNYEVPCYDVLTGFKHIADMIRKNEGSKTFIGGGEESYGFMIGDFVRDKDAVSSCTMIAEIAAWAKEKGKSLFDILIDIYTEFSFYKESLVSVVRKGKDGAEEIAAMMENFRNAPPDSILGSDVMLVHDFLKQKTFDNVSHLKYDIKLPKSNVLQFITSEGTKVSMRPSGTEPKIKFYFSVNQSLDKREDYNRIDRELEEKIAKIQEALNL